MDDYNTDVLSQAKNEYSLSLVNTIVPLIIEGFKSIFKEALNLCVTNDEDDKYLMTFQNFLTRVPKWSQTIVDDETKRIVETSKCSYLEDLLTCVYITQLKIFTSIRVSSKQKKIDINIPKLNEFIHKVYISCARKIYSNVYLFEEDILPLQKQKNMRECELICKECILNVIRENMPVEKILRAYLDETTEEEVVEETVTELVDSKQEEIDQANKKAKESNETKTSTEETLSVDINKELEKSVENKLSKTEDKILKELNNEIKREEITKETPKLKVETPALLLTNKIKENNSDKETILTAPPPSPISPKNTGISFNDNDQVVSYDNKEKTNTIKTTEVTSVLAPKTVERLEKISRERNLNDDDDDDDEDKIKIFDDSPSLVLDELDIHEIDKKTKLKKNILNDVIELK